MTGYAGGDNPFTNVIEIRQSQMFSRSYVAEKIGSADSCEGPANCRSNVVVARCNISHKGPQHIERRPVAEPFLQLHVGGNLIVRNVPRTFYHDLDAFFPGTIRQLPKGDEFCDLGPIRCIGKTAWTQPVA